MPPVSLSPDRIHLAFGGEAWTVVSSVGGEAVTIAKDGAGVVTSIGGEAVRPGYLLISQLYITAWSTHLLTALVCRSPYLPLRPLKLPRRLESRSTTSTTTTMRAPRVD